MHKTLAFFGAFNPPTKAHICLAEFAMRETGRESVLFVPSKSAYIRGFQHKDLAFPDEERLAMLDRIAESRPWMQATDIEMREETQPRTYQKLCALREWGIPATLLLGSDKLCELDSKWLHVPEICWEFGIVCLTRGRDECERVIQDSPLLRKLSRFIEVVETPEEFREVSSSEVRKLLLQDPVPENELRRTVPEEILPMLLSAAKGGNTP